MLFFLNNILFFVFKEVSVSHYFLAMASQETLLELSELDGDWEVWIKNVIQTKDYAATVKSFEELLSILPEDMNIWREYLDYLKNFQKPVNYTFSIQSHVL